MADESVVDSREVVQVPSHPRLFARRDGAIFVRNESGVFAEPKMNSLNGYKRFWFDGENQFVHQLMLEAFVGPRPPKADACHWNDIRDDNRIENLRWASHQENSMDACRNGRMLRGENNATSVFSMKVASEIKRRHETGDSQESLALAYGFSRSTISRIVRGRINDEGFLELAPPSYRKLQPREVAEIRSLLASEGITQQTIADRFGISRSSVRDIKSNRSHVTI